MSSWKIILVLLAILIPGGSLVLLAMATAKALVAGRDRILRRAVPVARPVVVLSRPDGPLAAEGGNG